MRSRLNIASQFSTSPRHVLTAVFLLIAVATNSAAFQEQARKRVRSRGDRFKLVEFVDDGFGWAAKDHGLWKTDDGGATWTRIRKAASTRFIDRIQLLSRNNGWILEDGALLHTMDGGLHWTRFKQTHLDIRSFRFVNETHGFSVAQRLHYGDNINFSREAEILRSSDGGVSWSKISLKIPLQWTWLLDIWPASPTSIWAVGDVILHSTDGGKTWKEKDIELRNGFYGRAFRVKFLDSKRGWIEADGYAVTTDGGKTWVPSSSNGGVARLIQQKSATRRRGDN
jgi:photosystem II stability/assembly factor-like uncharacterized protein